MGLNRSISVVVVAYLPLFIRNRENTTTLYIIEIINKIDKLTNYELMTGMHSIKYTSIL